MCAAETAMLWSHVMSRPSTEYSNRTSVDGEEVMSEHEGDSGVESTNSADSMLYIRIAVPDLNVQVGSSCDD